MSDAASPSFARFHRLRVASVQRETREAVVVTFDVPAALADVFRYRQGQYLTLRAMLDGEEVRRSYSICSAVHDERLRVAIKRVPGGLFSAWANDVLRAGDSLDVLPPQGRFHVPLDAGSRRHYLAFAAGSGITPILSIVKTTLLAEPHSRFTLFYGNRATSTVMFRDELASLKDQYLERLNLVYVMSRERQEIELFNGRLTRESCGRLFSRWLGEDAVRAADHAFICGPESMMLGVSAALQEAGMPRARILAELFAAGQPVRQVREPGEPYRVQAAGASARTEVIVVMDGTQASFTMGRDESVLDAGLRAGLELRWSCKGGVCSTCRCKVVEGTVDMDVNYALEDYEVARGFVLACQSYPVTDRVVLDFDVVE